MARYSGAHISQYEHLDRRIVETPSDGPTAGGEFSGRLGHGLPRFTSNWPCGQRRHLLGRGAWLYVRSTGSTKLVAFGTVTISVGGEPRYELGKTKVFSTKRLHLSQNSMVFLGVRVSLVPEASRIVTPSEVPAHHRA